MPKLKSCNFGTVNLMHPYFQKSGLNSRFWAWGQEAQRRWRADPNGLDPRAVIIALFSIAVCPAFASLTTKHFSALDKLCQVCPGTQKAGDGGEL